MGMASGEQWMMGIDWDDDREYQELQGMQYVILHYILTPANDKTTPPLCQ